MMLPLLKSIQAVMQALAMSIVMLAAFKLVNISNTDITGDNERTISDVSTVTDIDEGTIPNASTVTGVG